MRFGVMLPHYRHVADPDGIYRIAQEAEAMGFHSVWVSDHVVVPDDMVERFGRGYYDMFTVLGYVASITKRVQLGTSIVIMPLRHPLHTAQVAATVDQLSKGRLILGVGVGVAKREFECLNASWEDRGAITDEAIQALRHAWTVDPVNFEGKFFDFSGVQSYPPTYQKPHPPIWVGGGSRRSLRRAAELGDAWGPTRPSFRLLEESIPRLREMAERAGRDPNSIKLAARHPMKVLDETPTGYLEATMPSHGMPETWPLVDTAPRIVESVGRFQDLGVHHLVMDTFYSLPNLHDENIDTLVATMEKFARDVIPQFPEE